MSNTLRLLVGVVALAANGLSVVSSIYLIDNKENKMTSNQATWILTAVGLMGNGEDGYLVLLFISKRVKTGLGIEWGGPAVGEEPEMEESEGTKERSSPS